MISVERPTSCSSCGLGAGRSGLLRLRFGEGAGGFRKSSSAESELDMASLGFSLFPVPENTTITLGRGSVRLSWMKRLTRVVAEGSSGLSDGDCRSLLPLLLQPSWPLEPLEPFCCIRATEQLCNYRRTAGATTGDSQQQQQRPMLMRCTTGRRGYRDTPNTSGSKR